LDSCLEGRQKGLENLRGRRRRRTSRRRERILSNLPQTYLDSKGMGHETPFLLFLRPRTENEEEDPKKVELRPKLVVKETEINYKDKETEMK
jgi:hypothetical protein